MAIGVVRSGQGFVMKKSTLTRQSVTRSRTYGFAAGAVAAAMFMSGCGGTGQPSKTVTVTPSNSSSASSQSSSASSSSSSSSSQEMPSGKETFSKAQDRVAEYKSMTISTTFTQSTGVAQLKYSGATDDSWTDATVTDKDAGKLRIIHMNKTAYYYGDNDYWTALKLPKAAVNALSDKWVKVSEQQFQKEPLSNLKLSTIVHQITSDSDDTSHLLLSDKSKATKEKLDGKDVYKVVGSDDRTTIWVSADGKYDLLKAFTADDAGQFSELVISDQDSAKKPSVPPGAVDINTLKNGGTEKA